MKRKVASRALHVGNVCPKFLRHLPGRAGYRTMRGGGGTLLRVARRHRLLTLGLELITPLILGP